jgi:hypothetical protein
MLPLNSDRWDFCREVTCRDDDRVSLGRDKARIRVWLSWFKTDRSVLFAMRTLLAAERRRLPLERMPDDQVIDQMVELLLTDRVHLHVRMAVQEAVGVAPEATSSDYAPAPPPAVKPPPPSSPVPEDPQFAGVNPAAQAAVLAAAAQSGQPFCSECGH